MYLPWLEQYMYSVPMLAWLCCLVTFSHAHARTRTQEMVQTAGEEEQEAAAMAAEAFLLEDLPEAVFGSPKAGAGMWASCLRMLHPTEGRTLDLVQFEQNEAAFRSVGVCSS